MLDPRLLITSSEPPPFTEVDGIFEKHYMIFGLVTSELKALLATRRFPAVAVRARLLLCTNRNAATQKCEELLAKCGGALS